ncbi:dehydrogenase [Photobacterium proteolyticum]|uniref:Dehydrogenase n=1 Tax=Photobacterium proteolyticum TaxID=1903952 RepID=A0A1Q9GJX3_9GAMM|nr:FAD binding domain-containing protein [Photobacterium proteolyticum]OLQ74785.1 dehydrogenase [Photobacterium proteolyticum]
MVEVYRPDTLEQALDKLAVGDHTLFSGGTDLMVQHSVRPGMTPSFARDVVFVDAIDELKHITQASLETQAEGDADSALFIGAGVTLSEIERYPQVPDILRQSVAKIAAPALRNRATMAGNICNASPAADSLPALYLLDARVVLSSLQGQREMLLEDFILAPGLTQLKQGEMLTHVVIPQADLPETFYHKVGTRAANALTKLSVAGMAKISKGRTGKGKLVDWRVAFGAVGPTVVRNRELESLLVGQPTEKLAKPRFIDEVVAMYSEIIRPIDDQRSTAEYRHQASLNLLRRWLSQLSVS